MLFTEWVLVSLGLRPTPFDDVDRPSRSFGPVSLARRAPATVVSPDSTCGGKASYTCQDSRYGNCCSAAGFCGANATYCGSGCQAGFGTCPSAKTSSDGSCGGPTGSVCVGSAWGDCCSTRGYCGGNSSYCGAGCQPAFGKCASLTVSSDGSCGGPTGVICQGSDFGNCCSMRGYCGANSSYCGAGCQSSFGTCFPAPSPSSLPSGAILAAPSSSTGVGSASASASAQAATAPHGSAKSSGLSGGAVAGIVIGSLAALAMLAFLAWRFWRLRRRRTGPEAVETPAPPSFFHLRPAPTFYGPPPQLATQPLPPYGPPQSETNHHGPLPELAVADPKQLYELHSQETVI